MKYKGIVCEKCGVEVIQSKVRRERMGHIELAAPVAHIWFLKSVPTRIGILLDMTLRDLERVLYFENFVVTEPGLTPLKQGELLGEEQMMRYREEFGEDAFSAGIGAEAVRDMLQTALRYSELRGLRWRQIDLLRRRLTVGKSKTEAGSGRSIPLNERATATLAFWADLFPERGMEHFVFPSERYGAGGDSFEPRVYNTDPSRPIKSWKEAWESAKKKAGVNCRFHDLRHTAVTRMLEGGAPLAVVATILGWSSATTVRMAKRYGHIGNVAQRQAVEILDRPVPRSELPSTDPRAQFSTPKRSN